jgi:hypothetical protein
VTVFATGVVTEIDPAIGNVLSFAILIVPVTLVFAGLEAGVRQAPVGTRGRRLCAVGGGAGESAMAGGDPRAGLDTRVPSGPRGGAQFPQDRAPGNSATPPSTA